MPTAPKSSRKKAATPADAPAPTDPKTEAPATRKPATPKKAAAPERPVDYPKLDVLFHWTDPAEPRCVGPLDQPGIARLLGLVVETEEVKFGDDFLFRDRHGNKVRCTKNMHNRPLTWPNVEKLVQEHLNRRWAGPECMPGETINGETVIVDRYGDLQEGQHTLIAGFLAEQDRAADSPDGAHWRTKWPGPVTIDKLLVVGVSPKDEVINTINTGRPRSLADVLFRSEDFAKYGAADRKVLAKMCDHAIRTVWQRTGVKANAWAALPNHSESMDFLARHPKLRDAVVHVKDEDGKGKIGKLVPAGVAAGLLYLMAAHEADGDKYRKADEATERKAGITKATWDRACDFWALLPENPGFHEVRSAIAYAADHSTGLGGTTPERIDVVVRAWAEYARPDFRQFAVETVGGIELPVCRPRYGRDANQERVLAERPTFGGIDLPPEAAAAAAEEGSPVPTAGGEADPTAAEMAAHEAAKEKERAARRAKDKEEAADAKAAVTDPVSGTDLVELLTTVRKENPGKCLLFVTGKVVRAYGHDHKTVMGQQWGFVTEGRASALRYAEFPADRLQDVLDLLTDPKLEIKVGVCRIGTDGKPGPVTSGE